MEALAKRRSIGITGVLLLLMSLTVAIGLPAAAVEGNCTTQNGWLEGATSGAWGTITSDGSSVTVNLNAGYSLDLCVKGGNGYEVYNVTSSGTFWPPADCGQGDQQCGLSHWAIRNVVLTTTTTQPPSSTTSTTQPPSSTTSTTQPPSSTTQATTAVSVAGIQVSAPVPAQVVTQETLPFTGLSTPGMAALAAALAAAGALLLTASRQTEEKAPARSWN